MKTRDKAIFICAGGLAGIKLSDMLLSYLKPKVDRLSNIVSVNEQSRMLIIWIAETGIHMDHDEFVKEFIERFNFIQLTVRETKEKDVDGLD